MENTNMDVTAVEVCINEVYEMLKNIESGVLTEIRQMIDDVLDKRKLTEVTGEIVC